MVWFVYCISVFMFLLFAFVLIRHSEVSAIGVRRGLEICAYKLIPSMYPFMFLSVFFVSCRASDGISGLVPRFLQRHFKLPSDAFAVIIMSLTGGYPVGAKMTEKMLLRERITKLQAQRLMLFCVNPGPSFVIGTVGMYMLGSKKTGVIIFASLILATLTVMFFSKYIYDTETVHKTAEEERCKINLWESSVSSVKESTEAMLSVCSWVVLFSCVTDTINSFPLSDGIKLFIASVGEVTNGCNTAVNVLPVPIIAGIIGFGGLCVHMQIMSTVIKTGLSFRLFFASRIIHASLAVMYCMLLMKLFPVATETISIGSLPTQVSGSMSVPVSIGVIFMCILLLMGENYRIRRRVK